MGAMKTLHVVGFKNSGKTTLIASWVRLLKSEGLSVAVLKHHGHGGQPSMPDPSTDTMQFFADGADTSIVAGGGAVQLLLNAEPGFSKLKSWASIGNPDILLIEGYKDQQGEKVVLLRTSEDWATLQSLDGIRLVVGCPDMKVGVAHINSRTEQQRLDSWLLDWIGKVDDSETI